MLLFDSNYDVKDISKHNRPTSFTEPVNFPKITRAAESRNVYNHINNNNFISKIKGL